MALAAAVFLLLAGYLFLIAPARRGRDLSALKGYPYAHRGLYGNEKGVPENSMAAFQKAAEAECGIELDVQLTTDHRLVVFHDRSLSRMCGQAGDVMDAPYSKIKECTLLSTAERIPLFSEVLDMVDGRVPLIVEIKAYGSAAQAAEAAHALLSRYNGPYCVESFHPLALRWFKKHAPQTVRGQLASGSIGKGEPYFAQAALKYLLVNALSRPHFIAYDIRSGENISTFLVRKLFAPLWVAWTVRTPGDWEKAEKRYGLQIFEGRMPRR